MGEGHKRPAPDAATEVASQEAVPREDATQEDVHEEHFQHGPDAFDLSALRNSLQKQLPDNGDYTQFKGITQTREGQ